MKFQSSTKSSLRIVAAAALTVWLLAGCAASPGGMANQAPLFYPPLPNPPRIQYLTTLSGEQDVAPSQSGFSKFIVGEKKQWRKLLQPYGVAMFAGKVYVADSRVPGLVVFDLAQGRFSLVTGAGGGRIKGPVNVTIDGAGNKYVTDTERDQILVFDRHERFVNAYGRQGQFKPVDVAVAGERLYVTDIEHHQVHVLDRRTGRSLFTFGQPGSDLGELFHPTNLEVGPGGDIYVVETNNFRIQRFTAEGEPVRTYGTVGQKPGSFARPKGIAIDRDGRLYVGDAAFENIQLLNDEGRLLLHFGQTGGGRGNLSLPAGVALSYEGADIFQQYAAPGFTIDYVLLVASQFGPNKIDVFGFGKMADMDYPADENASVSGGR
ncbi:MAG: hypothetical protein GWN87_18615 [Desulfuromonadales bacterium]|nr:hypothetical protein [Desulfuromonadales bacterium]NIS41366.1 hypothetical protein [Desulfuromonadales bacterium]